MASIDSSTSRYKLRENNVPFPCVIPWSKDFRNQRPFVRILEVLCTAAHGIKYMFGMESEASNLSQSCSALHGAMRLSSTLISKVRS
jgi:hypothetical protein